jgi:putative transport protein
VKETLAAFLTQYPIVTLFGVIGVGYLLGQARIFGFRLGVAGVLFAGLAAGSRLARKLRCRPLFRP